MMPRLESRVLFLLSSLSVGGSESKTVRLANSLADRLSYVGIAVLGGPMTLRPQVAAAVPVHELRRRGKFSFRALHELRRVIRAERIDTVVSLNLYATLYAVLAKGARGRLQVIAAMNTSEFLTPAQRAAMHFYRHIVRRADRIMFGAEHQRDIWLRRYRLQAKAADSFVLYNGVDIDRFAPAAVSPALLDPWPGSKLVLGTVGKLRPEKGQADLIRAVALLRERGHDVGALIVGDGAERGALERLVREMGLDGHVRFTGEKADVRPYLACMTVFVLPSIAVETFSNAALEAMASGCPIAAADVGGMPEMLRYGGGFIFRRHDVSGLCERLAALLADPAHRTSLAADARRIAVERFGWPRMIERFIDEALGTAA